MLAGDPAPLKRLCRRAVLAVDSSIAAEVKRWAASSAGRIIVRLVASRSNAVSADRNFGCLSWCPEGRSFHRDVAVLASAVAAVRVRFPVAGPQSNWFRPATGAVSADQVGTMSAVPEYRIL